MSEDKINEILEKINELKLLFVREQEYQSAATMYDLKKKYLDYLKNMTSVSK